LHLIGETIFKEVLGQDDFSAIPQVFMLAPMKRKGGGLELSYAVLRILGSGADVKTAEREA